MQDRSHHQIRSTAIDISDAQIHLTIDRAWLERLVMTVFSACDVAAANISIAVTDDASIRIINAQHLGHDWATDVISFRLNDESDLELIGEVIVSAEMATSMAAQLGRSPLDEFALYVVHGLLHLCGHDDLEINAAARMRTSEAEVLAALGLVVDQRRLVEVTEGRDDSDRESMPWPV